MVSNLTSLKKQVSHDGRTSYRFYSKNWESHIYYKFWSFWISTTFWKKYKEIITNRKKREEDKVCWRGFILNSLSNRLCARPKKIVYMIYFIIKFLYYNGLENKYTSESKILTYFLIWIFLFQMVDSKSIIDQVN